VNDDIPETTLVEQPVNNPIETAVRWGTSDGTRLSARGFADKVPWAALTATLIVSLRVWSVAHLNLAVALQLVELTSTANVLLGLAVAILPTIMIILALYVHFVCTESLTQAIRCARTKAPVHMGNRALAFFLAWPPVVVIALAFSSVPSGLLIVGGVLALTIEWIRRGSKPVKIRELPEAGRHESPQVNTEEVSESATEKDSKARQEISFGYRMVLIIAGLLIAGVGFSQIIFDDTPWLPPEQIALTNGTVIVGYIAASSSSSLTVLLNSDRDIVTIPESKVEASTLCQMSEHRMIAQLFWGSSPAVPECSTSRQNYKSDASLDSRL
jgi:hypothetical protein